MEDSFPEHTILHLEDDVLDFELISVMISEHDSSFNITHVSSEEAFRDALKTSQYTLILSDQSMPGFTGMEALSIAKELAPTTPFIFISGVMKEEEAIESLKAGAHDYVLKSNLKRLLSALHSGLRQREYLKTIRMRENELAHLSRTQSLIELSASLAHQLNQPLTAISQYAGGCLHLLQKIPETLQRAKIQNAIEKVHQQAQTAGEIVHSIRKFMLKRAPERTCVNLKDVIHEAKIMMTHVLKQHAVKLIVICSEEENPTVLGDSIQLQQVLINLIQNAIDNFEEHNALKRIITLETKIDTTIVHLIVKDSGPGMREETRTTCFNQFFTTKSYGMGMGLSIVQRIVEAHRGQISLTSTPTEGTSFHLQLEYQKSPNMTEQPSSDHLHPAET